MRKNIASQTVAFQMVSSTDGSAVTTGTPTVYYTIDGGTQGTGAGTATHEGNGCWSYVPAQSETNGNHVAFTMVLTGAISQTVNVWPVSFDPTDSVRAGLTALPNAAADAAGGLPISDAGGLDLDTLNSNISAILTDTGTTLENHLTDIKGTGFVKDTHSLPQCLTATGFSTHSAADVWTAGTRTLTASTNFNDLSTADIDARLAAIGLDHLISSALPTSWAVDVVAGSVFDQIADDGTASYDRTTDSLQAIADSGGGGPTAAQIADAVWDEALAGHVSAGSYGKAVADIETDATAILADTADMQPKLGTISNLGAGSTIGANLADMAGATFLSSTDSLEAISDSGGGGPTAAQIADAVWDELQSGHVTAGSFGEIATEIASILADTNELQTDDVPGLIAALNDPTAAAIADAVWDELQSAHVTAGTFGEIATEIAALPTNAPLTASGVRSAIGLAAANLDTQLSTIDTEVGQIKAVTDLIPDAGAMSSIATAASITALNDISVNDILTTPMSESYSTAGGNKTIAQALYETTMFLGQFQISGTSYITKKLDGTTTAMTHTLDSASAPTSISRTT